MRLSRTESLLSFRGKLLTETKLGIVRIKARTNGLKLSNMNIRAGTGMLWKADRSGYIPVLYLQKHNKIFEHDEGTIEIQT